MGDDSGVLGDLLAEWEERRDRGEPITPEELCAHAPHLATDLRRAIRLLDTCNRLLTTDVVSPGATVFDPTPARVGVYEIQGELGHGGMGIVYRAWDPVLRRKVALKMFRPAPSVAPDDSQHLARRFRQEGQVLARLRHEHIVPVYDAKLDDDGPYFVMEYEPGGSLAEHRDELTAAGPAAIAKFLEQVARAVAHAHAQGVLHRDLKPGNILLDADGRPRVGDFGVAKLLDPSAEPGDAPPSAGAGTEDTAEAVVATQLTVPGYQPGTWAYMAPEQFDAAWGPVGPATDVWALGVILYELLAGRRPFRGRDAAKLRKQVCYGSVPSLGRGLRPRRLSRRLERVARRCLERDPAKRYQTADELADALHRAATPRRLAGIAGLIVILALGVGLGAWQKSAEVPPAYPDLPVVREAQAALARGQEVVLIDGRPPEAFGRPMGESSGAFIERDDGTVGVMGGGLHGCLMELLPSLPPGRFRVTAELCQQYGALGAELGLYAGGSAGESSRGRVAFFCAIRYADLNTTFPPDDGHRTVTPGTVLLAEDPEGPGWVMQRYVPHGVHEFQATSQQSPAEWRLLSLDVSDQGFVASWQGRVLGTITPSLIAESQQRACAVRADLNPSLIPVRTHGSVGIFVSNCTIGVRRFSVRPLPDADP